MRPNVNDLRCEKKNTVYLHSNNNKLLCSIPLYTGWIDVFRSYVCTADVDVVAEHKQYNVINAAMVIK